MPKYQIKKGYENRVFANSRRISDSIIESDEELNSIYLSPIAEAATVAQAPVAPSATSDQQTPQVNQPQTQPLNKEAN